MCVRRKLQTASCFSLLFVAVVSVAFSSTDTLSYYNPQRGYVFYNRQSIIMQAARFDLSAPAYIRSVSLLIGGKSDTGSFVLHVYGHEGGVTAPLVGKELMQPMRLTKSRAGAQKITYVFPTPILIPKSQFFIAVDQLTTDVSLLSDNVEKCPSCVSATDNFYYQFLKSTDGSWQSAKYAFVVDVAVDYKSSQDKPLFSDVTAQVMLPDTMLVRGSIAWSDANDDGFLDVLINGHLYLNNHGTSFSDATSLLGIAMPEPKASVFIDVNNDAKLDLLFIGSVDTSRNYSTLLLNDVAMGYRPLVLDIPTIQSPTTVTVADANGDGFLDVFIGGRDRSYLLLNTTRNGFTDGSDLLYKSDDDRSITGAQWIDFDGDRDLDLFARSSITGVEHLWRNDGNGVFGDITIAEAKLITSKIPSGCHFIDYDNDGRVDLLLPQTLYTRTAKQRLSQHSVLRPIAQSLQTEPVHVDDLEYEEKQSGAAWGDINSDGLPDFIITTGAPCRYADVYIQQPDHSFILKTRECGLQRLAGASDAVWVDYDNDGNVDLATTVNGKFRLYHNTISTGNFVSFTLNGAGNIGATITVTAGNKRYTQTVTSGRGLLIQEAARLIFGIGSSTDIQDVTVRWANGKTEHLDGITPNTITTLTTNRNGASLRTSMATAKEILR